MSGGGSTIDILQARLRSLASGGRLVRFATVGLVGTTIDFAVLISLVEHWELPLELAKIIAVEAAILVMFVLNDRWTFSQWGRDGYRSLLARLATSNAVRLGGLTVATVVLSALVRVFGVPYLLANAVGIACGFVVNFLAESYFTWSVHE
ncbi:GtrA family protein [Natranaeroarchaeum aerophilus]|uniref:GtrA family protein n=1 Tax=Natranaeroarchaeum aerophilus TaxID=2917711 RepID=A0AAE3K6F4_9EURY|nr:GtrA family protein [Natranaeroarchaeum aerophilus]MCL9814886.1 GtrA family protein [Natranaeroarchaeum aerophilus]